MQGKITNLLKSYRNTRITLGKLEQACSGSITYEHFAKAILALEAQGILSRVKAAGGNSKQPSLGNRYTINKHALNTPHMEEIKELQLTIHPLVNLERYYKLSERTWRNDSPYIKKIDAYLKTNGVPDLTTSMPQRSYELVADEKWLEEGGLKVLQRLGIIEHLKIETAPDPLMLSVHPKQFTALDHLHLVVENKTTYLNLANVICDTPFTSLIYGGGWKIVANLINLPQQLNLQHCEHKVYYFGDVDAEGISIWWAANKKIAIQPALAFYRALLTKDAECGKETQRLDKQALAQFLCYFKSEEQTQLANLLTKGRYYPQEALNADELQTIWRTTAWKTS